MSNEDINDITITSRNEVMWDEDEYIKVFKNVLSSFDEKSMMDKWMKVYFNADYHF